MIFERNRELTLPVATARPHHTRTCRSPALQARWLVALLQRGPEAAREAFALIPESVVRDMTTWLRWVAGGRCKGCVGRKG